DYDPFAARRRGRVAARRRRSGLRAGAAARAPPEEPDPPPVADFVGLLAPDPAGGLELAEAALDVARGLADPGGDGAVAGPAVILDPGPVLDQGGDDQLRGRAQVRIGEDVVERRIMRQRSGPPAGPRGGR